MKPQVTLKETEIKNFSINVVNNYEGCEEAIVYLKRIYGETVTDLRTRKNDFVILSRTPKVLWVINFLLNTITKPYRIQYVTQIIGNALFLVEDDTAKLKIIQSMTAVQNYAETNQKKYYEELVSFHDYLSEKRKEVQSKIKKINSENNALKESERFNSLQCQSQFYKAVINIIDKVNGNCTRDIVDSIQAISESYQWFFMNNSIDHKTQTYITQSAALDLIEYVGYFNGND